MKRLDHYWYSLNPLALLLFPFSLLFCLLAGIRRWAFRLGLKPVTRLPVPVIIVGNITVGGSGKTPLVAWLAERLKQAGYRPGIISRGYGGQAESWPQAVTAESDSRRVGDEPVLMARRTGLPVVVSPNRVEAGRYLLERYDCDLIISDDGMQHYALARDIEIAVLDAQRGLGNQLCLPAGPLRERPSRLTQVDFVVYNGAEATTSGAMQLNIGKLHALDDCDTRELAEFSGQRVHAIAGIGHPRRFFDTLRGAGLEPIEHPFADHHPFGEQDLKFADNLPVIMTEKDAVKCRHMIYKTDSKYWYLPVTAKLSDEFEQALLKRISEVKHG